MFLSFKQNCKLIINLGLNTQFSIAIAFFLLWNIKEDLWQNGLTVLFFIDDVRRLLFMLLWNNFVTFMVFWQHKSVLLIFFIFIETAWEWCDDNPSPSYAHMLMLTRPNILNSYIIIIFLYTVLGQSTNAFWELSNCISNQLKWINSSSMVHTTHAIQRIWSQNYIGNMPETEFHLHASGF